MTRRAYFEVVHGDAGTIIGRVFRARVVFLDERQTDA